MARHRTVLVTLLACLALFVPARADAALEEYHVYVIWLSGEGEGNRPAVDQFLSCLLYRSNFDSYFGSNQALVVEEGSYVVAPPKSGTLGDAGDIGPFIEALIAAQTIPKPPSAGVPVYVVYVNPTLTNTYMTANPGVGGRNAVGKVLGKPAGLVINTTNPKAFWALRDLVGKETVIGEHEIAEVIGGLRGGSQCDGDYCCEGWCNNAASCGNIQGLDIGCMGTPATTKTGAGACGTVKGWLVQTLSHQGGQSCNLTNPTCDFSLAAACNGSLEVLHAPCVANSDCCAGTVCAKWSFSGKSDDPPKDVCCKGAGESCAAGSDCCGTMACDGTTKKCACVAIGQACLSDVDCCNGLACVAGQCATPPVDAGAPPPSDAGLQGDGGVNPDPDGGLGAAPTDDGAGCSCRAAPTPSSDAAMACALAAPVILLRRNTRRSRMFRRPNRALGSQHGLRLPRINA